MSLRPTTHPASYRSFGVACVVRHRARARHRAGPRSRTGRGAGRAAACQHAKGCCRHHANQYLPAHAFLHRSRGDRPAGRTPPRPAIHSDPVSEKATAIPMPALVANPAYVALHCLLRLGLCSRSLRKNCPRCRKCSGLYRNLPGCPAGNLSTCRRGTSLASGTAPCRDCRCCCCHHGHHRARKNKRGSHESRRRRTRHP